MGSGTLRASCQFKACGFHGRRLCDAVYMSSSLFVCRFSFLLYIYIPRLFQYNTKSGNQLVEGLSALQQQQTSFSFLCSLSLQRHASRIEEKILLRNPSNAAAVSFLQNRNQYTEYIYVSSLLIALHLIRFRNSWIDATLNKWDLRYIINRLYISPTHICIDFLTKQSNYNVVQLVDCIH